MTHIAYIALGTNLGDRPAAIASAIERIGELAATRVLRVAHAIETEPVGCPPGSPNYLNTAAVIETELEPLPLLAALLRIEADLGRRRSGLQNESRPIDLDLLMYDDRVIYLPTLVLPHPRMHQRRFVLQPLAEIAPDAVHPTIGRTVAALLAELPE